MTGRPSMASRISTKSAFCATRSSSSAAASSSSGLGEDHAPHDRQPVLAEEHVLGAAQADALGAELAGVGGVGAVVGVGPHGELALADLVGPAEDDVELGRRLRRAQRDLAEHDLAGRAVERDHVALAHRHVAGRERLARDLDRLGAAPRPACPSRGPRPRRGSTSPPRDGEDALGARSCRARPRATSRCARG